MKATKRVYEMKQRGLLLTILVFCASPLWASSFALSSASLDWSGWAFTVSGSVVVSDVVYPMPPLIWVNATPGATASIVDGMLSTSARAQALETSNQQAQASTMTMLDFWLYGSGVGTVTVSVPYALQATCTSQYFNESAGSSAGVWLEDGPGVRANGFQSASLGCGQGSALNGMLTVSRDVDTAYGPLVDFMAGTQTMAFATVSDAGSSFVLLATALLGLVALKRGLKIA
jgi:hypothetical protein